MRIVDVCGFYSPQGGGIRTYVDQKLQLAERLGQDITILAPGPADAVEQITPATRILSIASPRFPLDTKYHSFANRRAVHKALDGLKPDFIEASSPWNSAAYVADYPAQVPRALIMHSEPLSAHVYRWFEGFAKTGTVDRAFDWFWRRLRRYGQAFDSVIAANSSLAERLSAGGVGHVTTVPMGVEQGLFSPARRDMALRSRLLSMCALSADATLLICAGRLATEKRVPMLVDAVTRAGRERPIGLAIFGEGRAHRKVMAAAAGNPHIRLFEPIRDREKFATILASADALLHGCEAETFGMIAAEAQASGIPVAAPMLGGASDFVRNTPAFGFQPADPNDVVRAILALPSQHQSAPLPCRVRGMEDHFRDLFAHYEAIARPDLAAAA